MAYGGYGSGPSGSRRPRRRFQPDQRTIIIVVVAVAIVVLLLRTHRISRFEIIYFLVLVPSIILHEISHGVVALAFGDDTAKRAGRLTLNPLKHVDPIGTILLPILLIVTTGKAFGWAKPVPVSINRLRHPRNQAVLVGLAGPAVNVRVNSVSGARSLAKIPWEMPTRAGACVRLGKYPRWTVTPLAEAPPAVVAEELPPAVVGEELVFDDPHAAAIKTTAISPTATR